MIIVSELGTKYDNPKPESVNSQPPDVVVTPIAGAGGYSKT